MGIWSTAAELASKTPPERNRYVDFLRAISILFVISGHWLIATAWFHDGELSIGDMLNIQTWTQFQTLSNERITPCISPSRKGATGLPTYSPNTPRLNFR